MREDVRPGGTLGSCLSFGVQFWLWRNFGAAYSYSLGAYQSGLQQIDFPAAVHLTPDELEASDLSLGLSVGPGRRYCRSNGRLILGDAAGERGDKTSASPLDP